MKMRRCEEEKMLRRRCEDEKMFYRPPLLEEPCAQTLSGKMPVFCQTIQSTVREYLAMKRRRCPEPPEPMAMFFRGHMGKFGMAQNLYDQHWDGINPMIYLESKIYKSI